MTPHHPRENVKYIDLERHHEPIRYGIDWLWFFTYSLAIMFSLSVWACLLLLALWWRS